MRVNTIKVHCMHVLNYQKIIKVFYLSTVKMVQLFVVSKKHISLTVMKKMKVKERKFIY